MENIRKNLERTVDIVNMLDKSIHQINFGPLRCEFGNVFRVSEQGTGAGLTPVRLYFFFNKEEKILHLLCLGTKTRQRDDLNYCKEVMQRMMQQIKQGSFPNG